MNIKKLVKSFKYAFTGIKDGIKSEQNMKIHFLAMFIVIIGGIIFEISKSEWIVCVILFGLVIASELFNTAIENIVDLITKEKNEKARLIKDVSAGAVLVISISSAISGLIIFVPKVIDFVV